MGRSVDRWSSRSRWGRVPRVRTSVLETFVLAASEQCESDRAMISGVLVVIPQSVHVLVTTLAITDAAGVRT